jgi:Fe-S-cluster containining protein
LIKSGAKLREEEDKKRQLLNCGKQVVIPFIRSECNTTGFQLELALLCNMSDPLLKNWQKKSGERQKLYKQYLHRAGKNTVLRQLPVLHEEAFAKVDCLQCANCCKNYSPRFKTTDIKRIAKRLRMKESVFIDTYLKVDEDGDFVANTKPCPFLGADNFCSIYEERPSDCQRFPYTDEDVIYKRQQLTLKNSTFCPITYYVLEKLMQAGK